MVDMDRYDGFQAQRLTHWFICVIRPVLEYRAAPWWLFKASNRIDRSNSETCSLHRLGLSNYNVYASLGGTIFCWASVCFWQTR